MTPEYYQRVREIYHAVCDLGDPEQTDVLQRLCGGDAELLGEVRSLLRHHDDDSGALADSDVGVGQRLLNDGARSQDRPLEGVSTGDIPKTIGRYHILRVIGEGGMGIVLEAEQDRPRRRVAIKLIRFGFPSESVFRRFQHEAELLGRLRHEGIAHIYEAGIHHTPTGTQIPYLAMERVHGVPLTEYVSRNALSTRARLELFARACDAIEHAHQNGVIHRDLKPGNILVDAGGNPKVLDFGIARATDSDVRTTTLRTAVGQLLGTVPYMSPEQAGGDPAALDTRSDVYSLGVILYELLTSRLPYDLEKRSIADAVRVIQETEPTRITAFNRAFRGDVETILDKALEKDKSRRYGSAAELAADIRRHLADLPLIARPASSMYQLRKFARRHRALVTGVAVSFVLLLGGTIGTTVGLVSARRANRQLSAAVDEATMQRDRARESESAAATELARSRHVTSFMRAMLRSVSPSAARDLDTTLLREILEKAVKKIEAGELADEPTVEVELRTAIAETYGNLGDNTAAMRVLEPAIRLADAAPPDQIRYFHFPRINYATQLVVWGRYQEAKAQFEKCMAVQRSGAVLEDEIAAVFYSNYAGLLATLGETEKALELHRRALDIRRRLMGDRHGDVAASMGNIAMCLINLKRYDEALALMQDALAIYRGADPPRLMHISILETYMADLLVLMDRPADAERLARDALDIGSRIYQPEHPRLGETRRTLGLALRAQGRHEEARECFARAAEILAHAFNEQHVSAATARMDLGIELTKLGRFAKAEPELLSACVALRKATDDPKETWRECAGAAVHLYERWEDAEPGKGHGKKAKEWAVQRRQLDSETAPRAVQGD